MTVRDLADHIVNQDTTFNIYNVAGNLLTSKPASELSEKDLELDVKVFELNWRHVRLDIHVGVLEW